MSIITCATCDSVIEGKITHHCGTGAICTGSVCGVCGRTNTTQIHLCGGAKVSMNTMDNPVPSKVNDRATTAFPLNPIDYSELHDGTTTTFPRTPIAQDVAQTNSYPPPQLPVNRDDPSTVTITIVVDVDEEKLERLLEKLERLASLREELGS